MLSAEALYVTVVDLQTEPGIERQRRFYGRRLCVPGRFLGQVLEPSEVIGIVRSRVQLRALGRHGHPAAGRRRGLRTRGQRGVLAAARIYDDVEPPAVSDTSSSG